MMKLDVWLALTLAIYPLEGICCGCFITTTIIFCIIHSTNMIPYLDLTHKGVKLNKGQLLIPS